MYILLQSLNSNIFTKIGGHNGKPVYAEHSNQIVAFFDYKTQAIYFTTTSLKILYVCYSSTSIFKCSYNNNFEDYQNIKYLTNVALTPLDTVTGFHYNSYLQIYNPQSFEK